jgi:hypothetical protein
MAATPPLAETQAHVACGRLAAATEAAAVAVEEAKKAWSAVWQDGAGDNDAAAAAWEKVEELQGDWESAAWEECEALKATPRVEGPVERGLSLSAYEFLALPRYESAHRQLERLVLLLRARGYAPASVEEWAEKARAVGKEVTLIRSFVTAHHTDMAAEAEIATLRDADARSTVAAFGVAVSPPKGWLPPNWEARVAAAGRSAAAREMIAASPLSNGAGASVAALLAMRGSA